MTSNLKSLKIFISGGGGGGTLWSEIPERGSLENLNQNFNHSSKLVHHSRLSHTTYVETNNNNAYL